MKKKTLFAIIKELIKGIFLVAFLTILIIVSMIKDLYFKLKR